MMKKYLAITLITTSMLMLGCSSSDDDSSPMATTDGAATDGATTDGAATDGAATDGAATDGATTDGAATDGATTDGAATDGATTDGAATDGATTDGAATDGETGDEVDLGPPRDFGNSVMGIVAAQPDLTLIERQLLLEGELQDTLNNPNDDWTFFAPRDEFMEGVTADRATLLAHIHLGSVPDLTGIVGSSLGMTGGGSYDITMSDDGVTVQIGGVDIVTVAIVGDNGIVYKIDGVLQ